MKRIVALLLLASTLSCAVSCEKPKKSLDNKKIIFIGDSFIYYG